MDLIDDKGRLFGTINIIDTLAVLFVLVVVAAGTAFVLNADQPTTPDQQQTTVTVEITGIQPYVADAIPEGPVQSEAIATVQNKSVKPTKVVVSDQNGTLHERPHPWQKTVILRVSLNTTTAGEDVLFQDEPLEVGRQLALDFGPVTVDGNVTSLSSEN